MRSVLLRSIKGFLTFFAIFIFSAWQLNAQVTCGANETKYVIELDMTGESWLGEVAWALVDGSGTRIDTASPGTYTSTIIYRDTVCLTNGGAYTFRAYDEYGDGWNGGTYSIYRECDNFIIADNGGNSPSNGVSGSGSRQLEVSESLTGAACPSCPAPSSLAASNITASAADLGWTENGTATTWDFEWGTSGFTQGAGTTISGVTTNPYTLSGLTANTAYDFYVRADCGASGGSGQSTWAGPFTFSTAFGISCPTGTQTAIFTEEFDNSTGWTGDIVGSPTNGSWVFPFSSSPGSGNGPGGPHSGSNYMYVETSGSGQPYTADAVSPLIDLSAGQNSAALTFYYHAFGATVGTLDVGVSTSQTGPWTSVLTISGQQQASSSAPFTLQSASLNSYLGQQIYIRFNYVSGSSFTGDVGIDLMNVYTCITCPPPSLLMTSNLTSSSVDVSWTSGGASNAEVEWGPTGFVPGNGTRAAATGTGYSITGLSANATYDIYVRDSCGVGDVSPWAGPETVTTLCSGPMAGGYTINPGLPASSTNFVDFAGAVSELTACGISAPVTINVSAGTYPENIELPPIAGASATNTILFDGGDSALVEITHTSAVDEPTIYFNGADHVTIQNMTVSNTSSTDAWGIMFQNGSDSNTINQVHVDMPVGTSADVIGIVSSGSLSFETSSGNNANYLTVSNSLITGGESGIHLEGDFSAANHNVGHRIINNTFRMQDDHAIEVDGQDSLLIEGNDIDDLQSAFADAIYLFDVNDFIIRSNNIISTDWAIYINDGNDGNLPTGNSEIVNNMIVSETGTALYLIDAIYIDVFHNSTSGTIGLLINDDEQLDVRNNIFTSNGDFAFESVDPIDVTTLLNYNLYYRNDAGDLADDGNGAYADLAAWQTADATRNANSIEGNPAFLAPDDLHTAGQLANNAGTPIASVTTDIDGDSRSATTPDIGADEYTPPSCPNPFGVMASNMTGTTVDLAWTAGFAETTWNIEYGPQGYTQGAGTAINGVTTNPYTLTGLTATTNYDVYIQADCGAGDLSTWFGPVTFMTNFRTAQPIVCGSALPVTIFSEEFGANNGWTGDLGDWEIPGSASSSGTGPSSAHSGASNSYMNFEASGFPVGDSAAIFSPAIDLSTASLDAELSFWMHAYGSDMGTLKVAIGNSLTGPFTDIFTWTGQFQTSSSDAWQNIGVDITAYNGQTVYLRFTQIHNGSFRGDMSIDLVEVNACVTCPRPTALAANNITDNSADLSWTPGNTETTWEVEYGFAGFMPGTGTSTGNITANSPYTLSGLLPANDYDYYVRAVCSAGDSSIWAGPFTFSTPCSTPLNGTYTVNPALPAGGANFISMAAAGNALNVCGISGPVIFNIAPGLYSGSLELAAISGASAVNTVTFDGSDSALVELTHTSATDEPTIYFNGANHVTIQNLTVSNTSSTDAWGVMFQNGSDSNTINQVHVKMPVGSSSDVIGIVSSGSLSFETSTGNNANYLTVSNSLITGGESGIHLEGDFSASNHNMGNRILNNTFRMQDDHAIEVDGQDSLVIEGNDIAELQNGSADAIYLTDVNDFVVRSNNIVSTGWGLYIIDGNDAYVPTANSEVVNNMVVSQSDDAIYLDDAIYTNVYHNTTAGLIGLLINDDEQLDIRNNIFTSTGDYAFESTDLMDPTTALNYNLYFRNDPGDLAEDGSNVYADLAAWQVGDATRNMNSVESDPLFVGGNDLHVFGLPANDAGTPLTSVTTDIDGDSRSATTPDIGADEYDVALNDAIAVQAYFDNGACNSINDTVWLEVTNGGINPITSLPVTIIVSGDIQDTIINTVSVNIPAFATDTIVAGVFDSRDGGSFDITVYTQLANDEDNSNDTAKTSGARFRVVPVITDVSCNGGNDGEVTVSLENARGLDGFLTTSFANNNGSGGNMFDINVLSPTIEITGFDINLAFGSSDITVYYKSGSYVGDENNASAWTFAGTVNVTSGGSGIPTRVNLPNSIILNNGINALFIGNSGSPLFNYYNGGGVGTLETANTDLEIYEGVGRSNSTFTASIFSPRVFSGSIIYQAGQPNYVWSNGDTTATADTLTAGSYTLTATDGVGCTNTITVNVGEPSPLAISKTVSNATCLANTDGFIQVTPSGGTAPYRYIWNNGDTSANAVIGDTSGIGVGQYTLQVIDDNNCVLYDTTAIVVEDTVDPVVNLMSHTAYLNATGIITIDSSAVENGSTDACGIATITLDKSSFTCSDLGLNTVTATVTDVNGNSSQGTATVTILDTISPTLSTQPVTVYLDASGAASVDSADIDAGTTDNCSVQSLDLAQTTFGCTDVGTNMIMATATDGSGTTSSGMVQITVMDTIKPDVQVKSFTAYLDANGNYTLDSADVDNGTNDACGINSLVIRYPFLDCSQVGLNWGVWVIATDNNGNIDSALASITVLDTVKPTVNTRDITVYLDSSGQVTVNPFDVSAGSFDFCGFGGNSLSQSVFTCADIGPNNVVYTHSDPNGNSDTGHAIITVVDTIGPFAGSSGGLRAEVLDYRFNESGSTVTNQASNAPSGTGTATINGGLSQGNTGQDGTALIGTGASSSTDFVATGWATNLSGDWTISFWSNNIAQHTNLRYIFGDNSASSFRCFTGGVAGAGNWALRGPVNDVFTTGGASTGPAVTTFVYDSSVPEIRAYVNGVLNVTVAQPVLTTTGSAFKVGGYSGNTSLGNGELMDNFKFFNRQLSPTEIMDLVNNSGGTATTTDGLALNSPTLYLDANGQAVLDSALLDGGNSDNCGVASFTLSKTLVGCSDIDSTEVVVTATDVNGNSTIDTTTVYVVDTIVPSTIAQDITIYLDGNGQQTIVPADVDNGSSDACGIATLDLDSMNFDCDDLGANPVVLTAIDVNGNSDTAWATVTVIDTVSPTVTTKNHITYLDASGNATIDVLDVSSGSSSACSIDTVIVDITSFTCANLGANTVTVTATASGGTASNSKTATVTVMDTISPTVVTQSFTTYLDASGNAGIIATDVEGGSTDNCSVVSYSVDLNTFDCTNLGVNTVHLTVTDQSGNNSTATATVTVVDTITPVAKSRDRTVYLDANGQVTITPAMVNMGSADNCLSSSTLSLSKAVYTCADEGLNQEYLIITDADGNVDSTDFLLTVLDTISPTLITKNITVQLGATGQVSIAPSQLDSLSSDNCSNQLFYTASKTTFNCSNLGANTVTLTGTDVHGNSTSATAIVTVEDNLAPSVNTQSVTLTLDANGSATLTPSMVNNGSTDNCAINSYSLSQTAFTCADLGTNTVVLTATDGSGNSSSANATITVVDNMAPTAIAQAATLQLDANGNATLSAAMVNNGSTDNCAISSMSVSPGSFGCADVGPNTVTLTVTDASGNSSTTTATVTVQDNVSPVVTTRNIAISLDASGNASILAADVNNGSSDACGVASFSVSPSSFTCADIGANTVTLTVTDVNGNSATGPAVVTVSDNMAPTVVTQSYTAVLDANGQATISPSDVDNGSTDNCGIASYSLDVSTFTCNALGQNAVNLTVTDQSGNSATGTAIVSVVDNTAPTVSTQNITVQLNASGQVSIQPSQINSGSTDNCSIAGYSLDVSTFTCADVGPNTVTLTATDQSGNSTTGTAIVTVQDNVAPNAVAQNITVQLDATGNASISAASVNNGSTDACGIASLSVSPATFGCSDLGSNSVTLTVTDNNGNSSTAAATVTVVDNIAPTVVTQNVTVYLNAAGTASITAGDVNNGSSDNCSVSTTTVSQTTFSCADRGQNLVTLTVTDGSGNSASAGASVMVLDTISPSISNLPSNITAYATAQSCAANVSWTTITGADNCSVANVVSSQANGSSFNLGTTTVNVLVTDGSGNTSSGSFTVTVLDTVAPVFTAVPTNISITPNPNTCDATVSWSAPSASDNCSGATISSSHASGSTFNVGSTTVTYTATDAAGNSRTGSFVVTVTDVIAPTISNTPANIVKGNDGGSCDAVVSYTMPAVGDNCSGASISTSHASGSTFPVGTTTVTFTATDGAGNTTTSSFTVTVEDREAPVASSVPPSDTVGQCNATYTYATPMGTDNCSAVTVRQVAGLPSGAVFPTGPTVNQFELIDAAGNRTFVSFTVFIVPQGTPQLPSLLEICANADPVEITGGQNITWSGNGIINSGTTFDPGRAGAGRHALNYTFTDDEGCQVSGTIQVTVTPQPKKPVVSKSASNTLTTGNYNDYQWYRDGVAISGATNQSYTYTVGGNYQVMVGNSFGCTNYSEGFVVGSSGGGIGLDEQVLAGLEVYPNPSNGVVNIALQVGTDKELTVTLWSIDGKKVYQKAGLKTNSTGNIQLNFGHLPTATYFLHIRTEDQVAVRKLLMN